MNKKADLSLSVNSIVVLILAITMLGLGLGFVSGMFGKVSKQVEEQISKEPEPSPPTASNPITLSRESIIANPGESVVLKVSIYNSGSTALSVLKDGIITTGTCSALSNIKNNAQSIPAKEYRTFNVLADAISTTGTKLCSTELISGQSKDFTVKIVS